MWSWSEDGAAPWQTSGVKQGHAALLSTRNNVPVWGTGLCCVVQKWRQKVSFLMVHAWRDQERELLQVFLKSVSENSSWGLNSRAHVLFQVKSLFLLPLIAQSDNITLYHSNIGTIYHCTNFMIEFRDSKHSIKEVPISLFEQCGLQASGQAWVSEESYEMVNKLGLVLCDSNTWKNAPIFWALFSGSWVLFHE